MQQYSGGPNPFLAASRFIGNKYKEGVRSQRDAEQTQLHQQTIQMIAANFEATKRHTAQQARLSEKAQQSKAKRASEFGTQIHNLAQPGTQVSYAHGDIRASYTSKMPTAPASKPTGRVPVKKVRGGKKPQ
jgi:hypothetical protein